MGEPIKGKDHEVIVGELETTRCRVVVVKQVDVLHSWRSTLRLAVDVNDKHRHAAAEWNVFQPDCKGYSTLLLLSVTSTDSLYATEWA